MAPSIVPWQRFTSEEQKKSDKTSEALVDMVKQKVMEDPMEKMRGMIGMLKEVATIFPTAGNQAPALLQQPDTQQPHGYKELPPPPPPGPPPPSESPGLPPNWQAVHTTNGTYYYNSVTRVSQYAGPTSNLACPTHSSHWYEFVCF